jgi:hypothetical protein
MPHRSQIDYSQPAMYARSEAGAWSSFGPMPLHEAVLLAVRKYRINHEACIFSEGLSLVGNSIIAVFQRPDFPAPVPQSAPQVNGNQPTPREVIAPVDRAKRAALTKQFGRGSSASPRPNVSFGGPMANKRELITPKGDKRYVRRDNEGRFSESDDVGRSLAADRRKNAKTVAKPGHGDKGDRKR